jgi:FKBP-type peptidyl-prolyl cis-trans isomerase
MKRLTWCVLAGLVLVPAYWLMAAEKPAAKQATGMHEAAKAPASQPGGDAFKSDKERVSYSLGMRLASGMKSQNMDLDIDKIAQAMKDVMADRKTLLTEPEAQQVLQTWSIKMREEYQKKQAELGEKNAEEGKKFLEENKKKEGIKTTASGLQYQVLKSGSGPSPKASDKVKVHYKGTLINGTQFDSSIDRGEPATFEVDKVIKGWTEAMQMMKVGDKWKLFIPSELAYGSRGNMRTIPPNSTLIFEVELLGIEPSTPPSTRPTMHIKPQ